MKKSFVLKGLIAAVVVFAVLGSFGIVSRLVIGTNQPKVTTGALVTPTPVLASFHYAGKEGVDALTLLKQQATVHESMPGFVDEINGRKANSTKHEYWAFSVNGTLASVGAGQYKTHNGDVIEWKIETY